MKTARLQPKYIVKVYLSNGCGADALRSLLVNINKHGRTGHSFGIDSDDGEKLGGWDGDGGAFITAIEVDYLEEGQTRKVDMETGDTKAAQRLAARYRQSFKYEPKESKKSKVEKLMHSIREATGISKGMAEDIADAIVRGREVLRLAIQKGWPIEDGQITGPKGNMAVPAT